MQSAIDTEFLELYKKHPKLAKEFLTDYTKSSMGQIVHIYADLPELPISKYTNNKSLLEAK